MNHLWILALALVLDAAVGDPPALWRRVPHPVTLLGTLIAAAEKRLNRRDATARRRAAGLATVVLVCATAAVAGIGLNMAFALIPFGWFGTIVVAAMFLAGRSLADHVQAVVQARDIAAAREAVSHVVGRDPESLDAAGIVRAAIESLAENFSDGVVAPAFWFALAGLPGLLAYKALNTADSMIGHMSARYRDFGRAAARLDDLANFLPARLAGLLVAAAAPLGGGSPIRAFRIMRADARRHRSPNAGWPEAAMAGALGLALAGPRRYGDTVVDDPFLNARGNRHAKPADILRALRVYAGANVLLLALVILLAALFGAMTG